MKKIFLLLIMTFLLTGCFKRDEMEDIDVITSIYPIEYVTNRLYGESSTVSSIYPKGIEQKDYEITDKQIKDFSKKDLFIYNGLDIEREYATKFLNENKSLKIIDASFGISYINNPKEVWLNPSNLLMMAQNIRNDLQNYITNPYMIEEIETAYELLKVDITQVDTEFSKVSESAINKQIITEDETFNFLTKYGYEIINLTERGVIIDKNLKKAENLLEKKELSYVFLMDNDQTNDKITALKSTYKIEFLTLKTLATVSDEDVANNEDYLSIMLNNIEKIKQEVYQ